MAETETLLGGVINELQKNLSIQNDVGVRKDGLLKEKTFMFTGKLTGISRAEAKSLIEENSGSIISNVSKRLDYLIIGEKPTKRKIDQANKYGIKIINEQEWNKILNS